MAFIAEHCQSRTCCACIMMKIGTCHCPLCSGCCCWSNAFKWRLKHWIDFLTIPYYFLAQSGIVDSRFYSLPLSKQRGSVLACSKVEFRSHQLLSLTPTFLLTYHPLQSLFAMNSLIFSEEEARFLRLVLKLAEKPVDDNRASWMINGLHVPEKMNQPYGEFRILVIGGQGVGKTSLLTKVRRADLLSQGRPSLDIT